MAGAKGKAGGKLVRAGLAHLRKSRRRRGGAGGKWKNPGNVGADWRLGPRKVTHRRVAKLTQNWQRYGGMSRSDFLRRYWKRADRDWDYPDHNGFATRRTPSGVDVPIRRVSTLPPGQRIDRFGPERGRYLSPEGVPFEQRALPPSSLVPQPGDTAPHGYHRYQVERPFNVHEGPIAEAFNQPGGATQYLVDGTLVPGAPPDAGVDWLVNNGFLKRVPLGSAT